ncbi:MAG: glycosyltransferase [Candidatus Eisenbacteria bacterium]|nr:glycosyltransferase [Candidatus Eisenbacteria bacterium]
MKVHYCLPTYNQPHMLRRAVEAALASDIPLASVTVVDLSREHYAAGLLEGLEGVTVITMPHNIGLGPTWNLFYALYDDYIVIGNDDVIVEPGTLRIMAEAAERSTEALFFGFKDQFSFFLLKKQAYLEAGPFDPVFWPIYWEDVCMGYRLRLLGYTPVDVKEARFEHEHSQSMKALDPVATELFWNRFKRNQAYYEEKWGGPRGEETFAVPFGGVRVSVPAKITPPPA